MEEPRAKQRPLLILVLVIVALACVGIAAISARDAMRGPEEILVPMPADIPYSEYLKQQGGGDASAPPQPATAPEAPAAPAAPSAPGARPGDN